MILGTEEKIILLKVSKYQMEEKVNTLVIEKEDLRHNIEQIK